MSLLRKLFAGDTPSSSSRHYIVDGVHLASSRGKPSPGDQLQLLRQLGRFAEKEKVSFSVVFDSAPLRKVGHGDELHGVTAYFSETSDKMPGTVLNLVKKNRRGEVMVITENADLEKQVLGLGALTMRSSTFRKALEPGGGGGSNNRSGGGRSGGNRRQRGGGNRSSKGSQQDSRQGSQQKEGGQSRAPREPKEKKEQGSVHELIDLVE